MLKKLLKLQNVKIVQASLIASGSLAKGLRTHFQQGVRILAKEIFPKLKDQNKQIIRISKETLQQFFYSMDFHKFEKTILATLKLKNPL